MKNLQHRMFKIIALVSLVFLIFLKVALPQTNPSSQQKDTSEINKLNRLAEKHISTNALENGFEIAQKALTYAQKLGYQYGIAEAYQSIAKYHEFSNNYRKAIVNYQFALEQYQLLEDSSNMARQSNQIGSMYRELAVYDTALLFFTKSLKLLENVNDSSELANTFNLIGLIYNSKGEFNRSLENLMESLELWQCTNDEVGVGLAYCNIGMVYRRLGEYEKALDYLQKTLEIEKKKEMPRQIIESYIQIGIIYEETGEYDQAIHSYQKGLKIARELNYKKKIAGCLNNIGVVYYDLRNYNIALDHFFESLEIKREIGDKHGITVTTINIAEAYLDFSKSTFQSNPDREVKYYGSLNHIISLLMESLKIAEETKNYQDLINSYSALINMYSAFGQYEEAVFFQEKLITLNDSLFSIDKDREIAELQTKLYAEQKEQEIAIMDAKNAAQVSQLKAQNSRKYIFMGGGIGFVLIILGLMNRLMFMRRTQKELQAKNQHIEHEKNKAQQGEKIKEKFLANMSHEIRTPMNSIVGMTNILLKNKHLKTQEKYLEAIAQSSDNLLVILNDILDLSNLEAGKIELENKLFDLKSELKAVENILQFKAQEKGIVLKCEVEKGVPQWIIGDPTRLNQVLINLIGNAIKFTEKGSVTGIVRAKTIDSQKTTLQFEIVDTGIGIPSDRLDAVFQSFTQADGNTTRHYGGTGLGLTISKQLVELQNGNINVKSKVGEGSIFTFEIPYEIGQSPDKSQVDKQPIHPGLIGLRILVAEDNEFNAMVLVEELNSNIQDSVVEIANDGRAALESFSINEYDIILMDILMPEMDGYTAAKAIRNLSAPKKNIPIIAMTASTMKEDIEKCFKAGMDAFISKPFETEELLKKIEELTKRK